MDFITVLGQADHPGGALLRLGSPQYREPAKNREIALVGSIGTQWHQDGAANFHVGTPELDITQFNLLILWSNVYPTELLLPNGEIVTPNDGEIVLVDNRRVKHRMPPEYVRLVKDGIEPARHLQRILRMDAATHHEIESWRADLAREEAMT